MVRSKRVTPRKQPTQERSREMVERLVAHAARVFALRGYAGTSTNHIAASAGVSVGSLYQYFPNKDALVQRLLEQHLQAVTDIFAQVVAQLEQHPEQLRVMLKQVVHDIVSLHAENPRLMHVLLDEAPRSLRSKLKLREVEDAAIEALARLLRVHALVSRCDPRSAAYVVVNTVEALTHKYVLEAPTQITRNKFEVALVQMLLAFLNGEPSSSTRTGH